jgi:hypothetical protein
MALLSTPPLPAVEGLEADATGPGKAAGLGGEVCLRWKLNKLARSADELPERGDLVSIHIPPSQIYLVNR